MKKILAVLICLVLIACAIFVYMKRDKFLHDESQTDATETTSSTEKEEISTEEALFKAKEILSETAEEKLHISYPYMQGSDQALNEFVNGEIEKAINNYKARWLYGEMYDELGFLTLEADYEITCFDEYTVSIVFKGYANRGNAAHPTNTIFTLNLDLKNLTRLTLSDIADIDTYLTDKLSEEINDISTPEIKEYLQNTDLISVLQKSDLDGLEVFSYSYIKDDSIVIVLFTVHALGDYVELPIK